MTAGMATIMVVVAISGVMWLVAKLGEMAAEAQRRQEDDARAGRRGGRASSPDDIERILRAAGVLGGPTIPEPPRRAPAPSTAEPSRPKPPPRLKSTLDEPEEHGGKLDAHHLGSLETSHVGETLSRRHLDAHGVAVEGRHLEPSQVGSRSISAQEATARVVANPLARLERLPLLVRAVALTEILGPPPSARRAPRRQPTGKPAPKPSPAAPAA